MDREAALIHGELLYGHRASTIRFVVVCRRDTWLRTFKCGPIFASLPVTALLSLLSLSSVSLMTPADPFSFLLYSFFSALPHSGVSIFLLILLCTHYFSRANLFPRLETTAYLREGNFALWSCSGQISRRPLMGWEQAWLGSLLA